MRGPSRRHGNGAGKLTLSQREPRQSSDLKGQGEDGGNPRPQAERPKSCVSAWLVSAHISTHHHLNDSKDITQHNGKPINRHPRE